MNEILKNIQTRRSIRNFKDEQIGDTELKQILDAALFTPSARNTQSWQFTVVQNKDKLNQLNQVTGNAIGKTEYNIYNAPTLIILSNVADNSNGLADCAAAMQSIFLAAHSLSIGSCWINQLKDCCNDTEVRKVLTDFGIPKNHAVYCSAALGYAISQPDPPERKYNIIFVK